RPDGAPEVGRSTDESRASGAEGQSNLVKLLGDSLMKKLKVLAGALALGFASQAKAGPTITHGPHEGNGSSPFLTARSGTTTYVRNLGVSLRDLVNSTSGTDIDSATGPSSTWTSESGYTRTFAGDSLFGSTFASLGTGFRWTITAGDSNAFDNGGVNDSY